MTSRFRIAALALLAVAAFPHALPAQSASGDDASSDPVAALSRSAPLEYGAFFDGGIGTNNRDNYNFLYLGVHAGKVLTGSSGRGWLRGEFEYGVEIIPFWQAHTPLMERVNCYQPAGESPYCTGGFYTGGTYTGVSIEPIILRWNLVKGRRWMPWVQGAGGVVWTNHKFPPLGPVPAPGHLGTSVFNFTPQFGVGVHYFIRPRQSITFSANAVHISNASLGDANPGVNASVQLSIGYTWWR